MFSAGVLFPDEVSPALHGQFCVSRRANAESRCLAPAVHGPSAASRVTCPVVDGLLSTGKPSLARVPPFVRQAASSSPLRRAAVVQLLVQPPSSVRRATSCATNCATIFALSCASGAANDSSRSLVSDRRGDFLELRVQALVQRVRLPSSSGY